MTEEARNELRKCLRRVSDTDNSTCEGDVSGRQATTCVVYECRKHMSESLRYNDEVATRYGLNSSPGVVPSWFDPDYAGESWDED